MTHPLNRLDQLEGCANGTLGVVLSGYRNTPDGHYRIADELLHGPAVSVNDRAALGEVAGEELSYILCIARL